MTCAGLVPLVKLFLADKKADWPDGIAVFGFFGGAAILTALSFHHALRSCPPELDSAEAVHRHKLWSQQMCVLMVGILGAGFIVCFAQTIFGIIVWSGLDVNVIEPVLLLVIIVCSTGFWSLLARSVVGGLLLAGLAQFALYLLLVLFATAIDRMVSATPGVRLSHDPEIHSALSWFVAGFGLSYAGIMLWLGRRRFATLKLQHDAVRPIARMPRLSFFQLTKIFAAGFLGYALFLSVLSVGTALLFPSFVKGTLNRSLHTFFLEVFYFFGFLGIIAAFLMLVGAWCVLRLTRRTVSVTEHQRRPP